MRKENSRGQGYSAGSINRKKCQSPHRLALMVCLISCAVLLHSVGVSAETVISLTPSPSDLSEADLRDYAAKFFSRKCGVPLATLLSAEMSMSLFQTRTSVANDGKHITDLYNEPRWLIRVQIPEEPHPQHPHYMYLTRTGSIISWAAHGAEFYVENPDIMEMSCVANPLPTDAKREDIISKVKDDLVQLHHEHNAEDMTYQTAFVFSEYFNDGKMPVWLVNVYDDEVFLWKGVYGYNGEYMSLVPPEQDYQVYTTPHERFFYEVFGDDGMDISVDIHKGYIPDAEAKAWLKKIAPAFDKWIVEHPYYANISVIDELIDVHEDWLR